MKRPLLPLAVPALALAAFVCSCTASEKKTIAVAPPLPGVNVAPQQFAVDPAKNDTLRMAGGTCIYIPADVLVDASGNPVKGSVDISYREFHGAADIIASGITMEYDSAGTKSHFISAGMFDIAASRQGQPVFIKKGKAVRVDMASPREGDEFNFYKLDQDAGSWSYEGRAKPQENPEHTATAEKLAAATRTRDSLGGTAVAPQPYDGKSPVFDIDVDYAVFPELQMFRDIVWQYAGTGENDPKNEAWVYSYTWYDAKIEKVDATKGTYRLKLAGRNGKAFETVVKPVLKGKDYQAALSKFNSTMAVREKAEAERVAREAELAASAAVLRSFSIGAFGIYNWDHQYHDCDVTKVLAQFDFGDDEFNNKKQDVIVYLIAGKDKDVIRYFYNDWSMFSLKTKDDNRLIAVLPGAGKVCTIGLDKMRKIGFDIGSASSFTFALSPEKASVKNMDELKGLIDRL